MLRKSSKNHVSKKSHCRREIRLLVFADVLPWQKFSEGRWKRVDPETGLVAIKWEVPFSLGSSRNDLIMLQVRSEQVSGCSCVTGRAGSEMNCELAATGSCLATIRRFRNR